MLLFKKKKKSKGSLTWKPVYTDPQFYYGVFLFYSFSIWEMESLFPFSWTILTIQFRHFCEEECVAK